MKKILFVCHSASTGGGVGKVLYTLIGELQNNYEIDLLERLEDSTCPFIPVGYVRKLSSMSYTTKYAVEHGKIIWLTKLWRVLLSVLLLCIPRIMYRFYIKGTYDYEISFNYLYPSYLISKSRNASSKKIMWFHGSVEDLKIYGYRGKRRLLCFFYLKMQKSALSKADVIVAISKRTAQSIREIFGEFGHKINIIYNGCDLDKIREINVSPTGSHKSFRLVYVGRLDQNKNVKLQIQAVKILRSKGVNTELFIIGGGESESELKNYAVEADYIHFMGYQQNPYSYIKDSDALILTSYSEGFPTVIVEAMALGKPVITTSVAGTEELINQDTGYIVDWNVNSVVAGILEMSGRRFDEKKIKSIAERYTKDRWGKEVDKMLKQLN